MGVTSLKLRLCAGDTGGEKETLLLLPPPNLLLELWSEGKVTLDLEPKLVAEGPGLLSIRGMRPLGMVLLW